jgi:hypothetical protein
MVRWSVYQLREERGGNFVDAAAVRGRRGGQDPTAALEHHVAVGNLEIVAGGLGGGPACHTITDKGIDALDAAGFRLRCEVRVMSRPYAFSTATRCTEEATSDDFLRFRTCAEHQSERWKYVEHDHALYGWRPADQP